MFTSDSIETERLTLRHFREGDLHDVFALMSDDYICRMAGIPVFKSLEQARRFMEDWPGGAYAVTEKGGDRVIGIIQTPFFMWERRAEIGYWMHKDYRGRGYMTEAVRAVCEELFRDAGCEEIRICVYVGNEASERVALNCGFHLMYDFYIDAVCSPYVTVESEVCYCKTAEDMEWECRGDAFFSTADPAVRRAVS